MKLYMTSGSPFSRKVRIVLMEKGLSFETDVLDALGLASGTFGPTLSVPVLDDGDLRIWESDLIVDYLLRTYPDAKAVGEMAGTPPLAAWLARPELYWQDMTLLATIATCADSIVNLRLMRLDGMTPDNSDYLARQRTRVERCLDWLETQITDEGFVPRWLSIMDIAFVCPMAYCEKREVMAWRGRPKLDALFDRTIQRPSFVKTPMNSLPFRERYLVTRTPIAQQAAN